MKTGLKKIAFPALIVFLVVSCVTINIYFPEAAVEKAADEIVDEIWGDEGEKGVEKQGLADRIYEVAALVFAPAEAHAEEADINVTTPAIRALKGSIQKRADSIKPYLDSGNVGIGNDGLLVVRTTDGLGLKEKAKLTRLVKSENEDRETLYSEIARANNFEPDKVRDIKRLFAKSWIKNAKGGWWVQGPDGNWARK